VPSSLAQLTCVTLELEKSSEACSRGVTPLVEVYSPAWSPLRQCLWPSRPQCPEFLLLVTSYRIRLKTRGGGGLTWTVQLPTV